MGESDRVKIAKISLRQAVIIAIISALFGIIGSVIQLMYAKPATENRTREISQQTVSQQFPVGTIIASLLSPRDFITHMGDSGDFDPRTTTWIPADGRGL